MSENKSNASCICLYKCNPETCDSKVCHYCNTLRLAKKMKEINDIIKSSLHDFTNDDDLLEAMFSYIELCGIKMTPDRKRNFGMHLIEKSQKSFRKNLREDVPLNIRNQNEIHGVNG